MYIRICRLETVRNAACKKSSPVERGKTGCHTALFYENTGGKKRLKRRGKKEREEGEGRGKREKRERRRGREVEGEK